MLIRRLKLSYLLWGAATYLCLHGLCLTLIVPYNMAVSYPFMILAPWLAFAACCWRTRISSPRVRLHWIMITAGLLLWASGMVLSAWWDLSHHISQTVAGSSDFVYFVYGVPILLAISSPTEGERVPLFLWLDGLQAVMTACMVYVTLFSVFPFMHQSPQPIPAPLLISTYNIENLVLACGATLRFLSYPRQGEEARFYRILSGFLWTYALCTGLYNSMVLPLLEQMGLYDLLPAIPFLLLTIVALSPPARVSETSTAFDSKPLALFIDNVSPILYTLALLALGLVNLRQHFNFGVVSIVIALAVYAVRTTTLQSRYMRSQRALRVAHDRLEKIALQDGLTGIANRRCFDQMLKSEWSRALRAQHPLSLLMIDIDYFKNLNDRYGHQAGDDCLVLTAQAMSSVLLRNSDFLARYGGEEFAVILPDTSQEGARIVASTLQEAVNELKIRNESMIGSYATISVGIATYVFPHDGSPGLLLEASDRALYRAKTAGRNRIELAAMSLIADAGSENA
jgi:diguanylate cyclase (GGDEF)-like protein